MRERHWLEAVLLSADDMATMGATEQGRVGGIAAKMRDAAKAVLEARTGLRGLAGRVAAGRAWRVAGDSVRSLAGMSAR